MKKKNKNVKVDLNFIKTFTESEDQDEKILIDIFELIYKEISNISK